MDAVSIVIVAALLLITYKLLTKNFLVFKKRGIEFEHPTLLFGNMLNSFLGNETDQATFKYLYEKFDREKLFGMFMMTRPVFVVKDVDLIREMTIKHFDNFKSGNHAEENFRDVNQNASSPSLSATNLTQNCMNSAADLISQLEDDRSCVVVNTKESFEKIVAESMSKSLGVNHERINEVHENLKLIETDLLSFRSSIKALINSVAPKALRLKLQSREVCKAFGELCGGVEAGATENSERLKIQLEMFASGGFRSIVRLLQACFFELAKNCEVQKAVMQEIDGVAHQNFSTSELAKSLNSLDFLDAVIKETLRKHPPVAYASRVCTEDCFVTTKDGEQLKFVKDDVIHIPIKLIQNDTRHFPNPDLFEPFRFAIEKSKRNWLPFGPTNCPGADLVTLFTKTLVFSVFSKFSVELKEESKVYDENHLSLKFVPRRQVFE